MLTRILLAGQWRVLHGIEGLARRSGRMRERPEHLLVGERGEREALFHLRSEGYTVVGRRWTTGRLRGDLDLVAWDRDWLCFVEVKTRAERNALDPAEAAVDGEKRRMLRKMARAYLQGFAEERRRAIAVRFDVVAVYLSGVPASGKGTGGLEFELFRGAFGWRD